MCVCACTSIDIREPRSVFACVLCHGHTLNFRGSTFRESLKRIGEVWSILPEGVHVMALTATATKSLRHSVSIIFGMIKLTVNPCKENIMYSVGKFVSVEETLSPIVEKNKKERRSFPRMVIYGRTFDICAFVHLYTFTFKKIWEKRSQNHLMH